MNNKEDNSTSFWISYADLMAGLLFVFILLIGAIIIKYSLLENESKLLQDTLSAEKIALEKNQKVLLEKEERIRNTENTLLKTQSSLENLKAKLHSLNLDFKENILENEKLKEFIQKDKQTIEDQKKSITSKDEEINKANKTLEDRESQINVLRTLNKENENKYAKLKLEKEDLIASLNLINKSSQEKDKKINDLANEIVLKEKLIVAFENKNMQLDDELKVMNEKLKNTELKHEVVVKDLENTKIKIKNFTGIKIKVITLLKQALGKDMQIDPKNGAIRLSSNILFDEGEFKLKENSKDALKSAVYEYFNTILKNKEINRHIDKIIIEGHTNSKGSFLYNLELSQKRAYSVMSFLLDLDFDNSENLKDLVVASGRSFLDPIYKNGIEDRNESRRIEIKFSLKNEQAIKEIESILDN